MTVKDDNMTRIYNALGNPIRREIIDVLRARGKVGFKELHESVKISVGALYHHLEALEDLVAQGPDKKYFLTDHGRAAVDTLSVSEEKITIGAVQPMLQETRLGFLVKEGLFGRSVFQYLNREPVRSLPIAILIVVLGGWLSFQSNLEPLLLFYVNPSPGISRTWFMLMFPIGWLATFIMTDVLSVEIFKRKGGDISLLTGTAFAMLPLLIVPAIFFIAQAFSFPISTSSLVVLAPIILQVWVICLLSGAISISKGLKMERTALISLGVIYLNILALLASLELGVF